MFKNGHEPGGPAMGVVVTYLAYLIVSVTLIVFVGSALSRSGRIFLVDVLGGRAAPAQAASRLMVVAFYLLNFGFVTLTLRTSGEIGSVRQAIQVLSVKIGEVLLVLGALYLADIGFLARLRLRLQAQAFQLLPPDEDGPEAGPSPRPGPVPPPEPGAAPSMTADSATTDAQARPGRLARQADHGRTRDEGLWRPRPRQALH
jgi:hypothetical protein